MTLRHSVGTRSQLCQHSLRRSVVYPPPLDDSTVSGDGCGSVLHTYLLGIPLPYGSAVGNTHGLHTQFRSDTDTQAYATLCPTAGVAKSPRVEGKKDTQKERIIWLDIVRAFSVILIICGHFNDAITGKNISIANKYFIKTYPFSLK